MRASSSQKSANWKSKEKESGELIWHFSTEFNKFGNKEFQIVFLCWLFEIVNGSYTRLSGTQLMVQKFNKININSLPLKTK
jgi:hypothetical protein